MDYEALFDRILRKVDTEAYLGLADVVAPEQRKAVAWVHSAVQAPDFDAAAARERLRRLHAAGQIDKVIYLSSMHVIEASPRVADYDRAARLVADQEMAALELGGPRLQDNLASVDRHRGVLAFLKGRYEVAADYFSRAFERQRSPGNLANVLATLLKMDDEEGAAGLLGEVRRAYPDPFVDTLDHIIAVDPDLALLRSEDSQ